jgi:formate-dependent nitrite reductase cytochrome c552 subunit
MATPHERQLKQYFGAIGLLAMAAAATAIITVAVERPAKTTHASVVKNDATNHPVHIRQPKVSPRVATGLTDLHGQAVTVSCATCHSTTTPNPKLRAAEELSEFHRGLSFNHGQLSCLSCHNSENYDSLRLADGTAVAFENVQNLCAQCHGPQTRDYRNGSHGGMNGFWDLTRGPRTRNNCTDCHDPHSPQFQPMMPVFEPVPTGKKPASKH